MKTYFTQGAGMKASQKDIAEELGVSQMTVSLALSGRHGSRIKPELAERIRSTAKRMGYHPSVSAQNLRTAPTALGLLILQDYEEFRPTMECHDAISNFIRQCRRCLRTFQVEWFDQERHPNELPRLLTDGLVGGVVCFGHADGRIESHLADGMMPVVKINEPGRYTVSFDMENDIRRSVRALHGLGHDRIGIFNCSVYQVFTRAKAGFDAEMKELGLTPACVYETRPDGVFARDIRFFADQMAQTPPERRPTVLLADTALTAKALVSALLERGIRIPADLGIFTFCSVDWENDYFVPSLSGLEYTFDELIESSVGLLMRLMDGGQMPDQNILISQKITFRESVLDIRNAGTNTHSNERI